MVESDDKKIEKKDKNVDEPVQFYTGKDKLLYELVINTVNKNQVIGIWRRRRTPLCPCNRRVGLGSRLGELQIPRLRSG